MVPSVRTAAAGRRRSGLAAVVAALVCVTAGLSGGAVADVGEAAPSDSTAGGVQRQGTGPAGPPTPDQPGVKRLGGRDRYSTAAAVVADSFPTGPVPVVFIATGESFADALAGGTAADLRGGPVLPVAASGIPAPVARQLERLDPAQIVILGGTGAVSEAIARRLTTYTDGTVSRIAGANRYDTAARVARSAFAAPVPQVVIATGAGFADALAGGAAGGKTNSPVLLVAQDRLPAETAAALRALRPQSIAVLGRATAVSDPVLEQLRGFTDGGVTRLAGSDRYDTAARTTATYWRTTTPVVYLATGRDFPDALAAVPAAGRDEAPTLLVERACMPAETKRELDRLKPRTTVVLGGTSAISDGAVAGSVCPSAAPAAPAVPAAPAAPSAPGAPASPSTPAGWRIAWADEFDGSSVDTGKWNVRNETSNSNEQSYLLARNATVSGGALTLQAKRESVGGKQYSSAYLDTIGKSSFGLGSRWEIRAKVPTQQGSSQGLWPAFWIRSNETAGEIDIAEWYGSPHPRQSDAHRKVDNIVHESTNGGQRKSGKNYTLPQTSQPSDGFHVYAAEVLSDGIHFYVDGVQSHSVPAADGWLAPMLAGTWNIRLNFQIGKEGSWATAPTSATRFPAEFVVDYVRVYRR